MAAAVVAQSQALAGSRCAARQQRCRTVRVAAVHQEAAAPAAPLRLLAAGLAAAALSVATPAQAGVVLVQPEVKNFVKDQPAAAAGKKAGGAPAAKKAAPKREAASSPGGGFENFRPLVLPLALLAVGGAGAAAVKADPEFARQLDNSWGAKNSNAIGAGYETAPGLKDGPFFGGSNTSGPKAAPKKAAGTAKKAAGTAKKAAGTAKKAAGTAKKSVLGSVFGSRG